MAVFGSTINPALGRVDYSPPAQGLAMGGELSAQGLSNFGQGVTQGIQNFLKKQEEKRNEEEGIAFIKNQMPGIDDATAKAAYAKAHGHPPRDHWDVKDAMRPDMAYRVYSAIRLNAQEMTWQSVSDAVERELPAMIEVAADAARMRPQPS